MSSIIDVLTFENAEHRSLTRRRLVPEEDTFTNVDGEATARIYFSDVGEKTVSIYIRLRNPSKYPNLVEAITREPLLCEYKFEENELVAVCRLSTFHFVGKDISRGTEFRGFINVEPSKLKKLTGLLLLLYLATIVDGSRKCWVEEMDNRRTVLLACDLSQRPASRELMDVAELLAKAHEAPSPEVVRELEQALEKVKNMVSDVVRLRPEILQILEEHYGISREELFDMEWLGEKIRQIEKYLRERSSGGT